MSYIPHTPEDLREMLGAVGVQSVEELFAEIPAGLRFAGLEGVPGALSELEVTRLMQARAADDGGALCFIGALTPSLVPRAGLVQGALAGFSFAIGYGVGVLLSMIWQVLHLPVASEGARRWLFRGVLLAAVIAIFLTLGKATDWQNALHTAMGLPPVESVRPFTIASVSIVVASLLIAIGRAFRKAALVIARRLSPIMPERLALVLGILLAVGIIHNKAMDQSVRAVIPTIITQLMGGLRALGERHGAVETVLAVAFAAFVFGGLLPILVGGLVAAIGVLLGAAYMLWMYQRVIFGPVGEAVQNHLGPSRGQRLGHSQPDPRV